MHVSIGLVLIYRVCLELDALSPSSPPKRSIHSSLHFLPLHLVGSVSRAHHRSLLPFDVLHDSYEDIGWGLQEASAGSQTKGAEADRRGLDETRADASGPFRRSPSPQPHHHTTTACPLPHLPRRLPSMDDTAPPTVESLQERVRELEKANAELVADKGTLVHVATELARVLSLQRPFLEPEGVWIQDGDLEWMDKIVELSRQGEDLSHGPYDRVWRWQKVSSLFVSPTCASTRGTARHPSPDVPCSCFLKGLQARKEGFVPKLPKSKSWHDRQLEARVAKRPFSRTFPLELFEAIIAHADTRAISRTAQASFACYQLFMPVLLDRVHAVSRMYSPGLRTLFAARDAVSLVIPSHQCHFVLTLCSPICSTVSVSAPVCAAQPVSQLLPHPHALSGVQLASCGLSGKLRLDVRSIPSSVWLYRTSSRRPDHHDRRRTSG